MLAYVIEGSGRAVQGADAGRTQADRLHGADVERAVSTVVDVAYAGLAA